jgi:hypothetical protein
MTDNQSSGPKARAPGKRKTLKSWSNTFLAHLASTSNVTASAKQAGIDTFTAYEARRDNVEFRQAWFDALCEGYEHLEMDLLLRLRSGEIKPAAGAKKGVRIFDNSMAVRQLAMHRETVAKIRAQHGNESEAQILAELDTKLERMRQQWLASRARVIADARQAGQDDEEG